MKKTMIFILAIVLSFSLIGCSNSNSTPSTSSDSQSSTPNTATSSKPEQIQEDNSISTSLPNLSVTFGYDGESFTMVMEDNDTAAAIVRYVGQEDWNLPINNYNNFDNWEVMQYYDIPSRYEIPSNPSTVTDESLGDVYYSAPNRIILFYDDAQVTGEYTKIGTIAEIDELKQAVESNPVLEGWGNKIVIISPMG